MKIKRWLIHHIPFPVLKSLASFKSRYWDGPTLFYPSIRDVLANSYLKGEGLEIGALHHPLQLPQRARAKYVDRMPVEQLRLQYPELNGQALVQVDVVDDGEKLVSVENCSCDFVIANHMIEHTEDPIGTLKSWFRVLKPSGILYLAVPLKDFTFDRDRPTTTISHLVADHEQGPSASRRGHFDEFVRLVEKVPDDQTNKKVNELMEQSYSIHFHVWTAATFLEFLLLCKKDYLPNLKIEAIVDHEFELICVLRSG